MRDARETVRETFELLQQTATIEQRELLIALKDYVSMLHDIIDHR